MKLLPALLLLLALTGCATEPSGERIVPPSGGRINHMTIVIPDDLWEGRVGDSLRNVFAAPVDGLPREEPLFSITQMPNGAFVDFAQRIRSYVQIDKGEPSVVIRKDRYATPQTGVIIRGNTQDDIIQQLQENRESIVQVLKQGEVLQRQRQIAKSMLPMSRLQQTTGVTLNMPSAYRYASKPGAAFNWLRRDIRSGDLNVTVYDLPYSFYDKDSINIDQIIRMRDSIGSTNIETAEGGSFITEQAYAPYLNRAEIAGLPAFESKGMWEVKNKFMAGPFINYIVNDSINKRWLVLEGFAFAPSLDQREYMFELESILKSARISDMSEQSPTDE